jgi:hypothetical protein
MRACRFFDPHFGNDPDVTAQALLAAIHVGAWVKYP